MGASALMKMRRCLVSPWVRLAYGVLMSVSSGVWARASSTRMDIRFVQVVSGDRIEVEMNGLRECVRLAGIRATSQGETGFQQAQEELRLIIGQRRISLYYAKNADDRDSHGCLVAYVMVADPAGPPPTAATFDEGIANLLMVSRGWARHLPEERQNPLDQRLQAAEWQAMFEKRAAEMLKH